MGEGNIWLIIVQVGYLSFDPDPGCQRLFVECYISLFDQVEHEGCKAGRIGPEIGAGEGHLFDFIGMADGHQEGIDAAVAPADDIAAVEVEGIEQGVEIVHDHLEGEGIGGVVGLAVGAGVDGDDVETVCREIGDLVGHISDGPAVTM